MLPKANQALTITKVRRITRIKDLSRRRKGLPTSLASSATATARKATIRTSVIPGSSVMTYKNPASTNPRTNLFELRKALVIKLLKRLNS
jgi:hypothetical protein